MTRIIYTYDTETYFSKGWLKVGDTGRDVITRIEEQVTAAVPEQLRVRSTHEIDEKYRDYQIHNILENRLGKRRIYKPATKVIIDEAKAAGIPIKQGKVATEWFVCTPADVASSVNILNHGVARPHSWSMRPEQNEFVTKAYSYFQAGGNRFLGNCKCRFGKTFATYNLMKKLGAKTVLILTFKPAVGGEWESNLNEHIFFDDYVFHHALNFDKNNPIKLTGKNVDLFASFQDILGKNCNGNPKQKWNYVLEFIKKNGIDLLVIDEAHFGADKKRAQELIDSLNYKWRLDLSGTPLDLLMSGQYTDTNTYNFSYVDERKLRAADIKTNGDKSCYYWLPELNLYRLELGQQVINDSDAYSPEEGLRLNKFFASDDGKEFINKSALIKWLDLLAACDFKIWASPFNDNTLAGKLDHIFWILPDVNSCRAMLRLLRSHRYFKEFRIVPAFDDNDGEGRDTVRLVKDAIRDHAKTITLSCGKLNTGVTIKEWSAVFYLSDTVAPETYWQTIFRCQSECPELNKQECFVFDFNPNRTLKMIYEYCETLAKKGQSTQAAIREFLDTVKVLSYDSNRLVKMSNSDLEKIIESTIDVAKAARRFESVTQVAGGNISAETLNSTAHLTPARGGKVGDIEFPKSPLKSGKVFVKPDGNKNGKQVDATKVVILRLVTILKALPTFLFLSQQAEESIDDIINTSETDLFETITTIKVSDLKRMVEEGSIIKERVDRSIQALTLAQKRK